MLKDIKDTPTYRRLVQEGKEEGARQLLIEMVQTRFPSLSALAEERLEPITDLEVFHRAMKHIVKARNVGEARLYLQGLQGPQPSPSEPLPRS